MFLNFSISQQMKTNEKMLIKIFVRVSKIPRRPIKIIKKSTETTLNPKEIVNFSIAPKLTTLSFSVEDFKEKSVLFVPKIVRIKNHPGRNNTVAMAK